MTDPDVIKIIDAEPVLKIAASFVGPKGDKGDKGDTGAAGAAGATGSAGPGLPAGGTTAQVARKHSNSDYDTEWHTLISDDVGLGNVTNDAQLKASQLDTDNTLAANSDTRVASQKAAKGYIDNLAALRLLIPIPVKNSAYTAAAGDLVPVDTTLGNVAITLPPTPADKAVICIKHIIQGQSGSTKYTVTVSCSGSDTYNKAGGSQTATLSLLAQAILLQYQASSGIWYVVGDDLPLGVLDNRYVLPQVTFKGMGAAGDAVQITDGAMTSGSNILTSASNPWTAVDVGKTVAVANAGGITSTTATLVTTITGFTNSGTVTLAANAANSVTGATVNYGTDDTVAINNALALMGVTDWCWGNKGRYLITDTLNLPATFIGGKLEGASRGACTIIQCADNKPVFKLPQGVNSDRSHQWTIKSFSLTANTPQSSLNTSSCGIYFSGGANGVGVAFNFLIEDIQFTSFCDAIGSPTDGSQVDIWGGKFRYIRCAGLQRSFINVTSNIGQVNNSFDQIYIDAATMVGPIVNIDGGTRATRMDAFEVNSAWLGPELIRCISGGSYSIGTFRLEAGSYTTYGIASLASGGTSNGKAVSDAGMTSGQNIVTSATAAFTNRMVGWTISIAGAGPAGGMLTTTISGFISATQVATSANASTTVSNASMACGNNSSGAMFSVGGTTFLADYIEIERVTVCLDANIAGGSPGRGAIFNTDGGGGAPIRVNHLDTSEWALRGSGTYVITNVDTGGFWGDVEFDTISLPVAGTLSASGTPANGDTVRVGSILYTWRTVLSTGPTVPNEVLINGQDGSLTNLAAAINHSAGIGTNYSTGTVVNPNASVPSPVGTNGPHMITFAATSPSNSLVLDEVSAATFLGGVWLTDIPSGNVGGDNVRVLSWNRMQVSNNQGDNDVTVMPGYLQANILSFETTLTANRTVFLPKKTQAGDLFGGLTYRIVRSAGGAFNLVVKEGTNTLATIGAPTSGPSVIEFKWRRNGTVWVQTAKSLN